MRFAILLVVIALTGCDPTHYSCIKVGGVYLLKRTGMSDLNAIHSPPDTSGTLIMGIIPEWLAIDKGLV